VSVSSEMNGDAQRNDAPQHHINRAIIVRCEKGTDQTDYADARRDLHARYRRARPAPARCLGSDLPRCGPVERAVLESARRTISCEPAHQLPLGISERPQQRERPAHRSPHSKPNRSLITCNWSSRIDQAPHNLWPAEGADRSRSKACG